MAPRPLPTGILDAAAAHSFARPFFVASRAGVLSTARRVVGWRRLALRAAEGSSVDVNLLEAIVYVESSGVAGAVSGPRAGLTQLTPRLARQAGLRVNVRRSRRLTREIAWWVRHGDYREARRLARRRADVDRRFSALAELRATVRTLERAKRSLRRTDLAVASLHLGVGGLRGTVRRAGAGAVSYAELYFGSDPHRRRGVYRRLTAHGPAAYDYYWRVLAARRVLQLYRRAPGRLLWEDRQQHRKSSAEEVLHPRSAGLDLRGPAQLERAWRRHLLVPLPRSPRRSYVAVDALGGMAPAIGSRRSLYRGLRPGAAGVLRLIGSRVHELTGSRTPIHVTSAVRDDRYQAALRGVNPFAARTYSLHTTGFTFDISRSRLTRRQERALRWVLDRLTAANAVAYIEEPYCFHVTVSSRAVHELGVLRRAS